MSTTHRTLFWDLTGEVRCEKHAPVEGSPAWTTGNWHVMPDSVIRRMERDGHDVCCPVCEGEYL